MNWSDFKVLLCWTAALAGVVFFVAVMLFVGEASLGRVGCAQRWNGKL